MTSQPIQTQVGPGPYLLIADDLFKSFGQTPALSGASLSIASPPQCPSSDASAHQKRPQRIAPSGAAGGLTHRRMDRPPLSAGETMPNGRLLRTTHAKTTVVIYARMKFR
jgi:hypothetical protein